MVFTVAVGSGVAIIPSGNTAATTTRHSHHLIPSRTRTRTRRNDLHLACGKKFSSDSHPFSAATETEATDQVDGPLELDGEALAAYNKVLSLIQGEPEFWQGPQWEWLGIFVKYSWIFGFFLAAGLSLYGCFTYHEPPKKSREAFERVYGVRSGAEESGVESNVKSSIGVFEEPDAYDVFDSNPTEVAPSLE